IYDPGSLNSNGQQQPGFSSPGTKAEFGFIAGISAEKNISKKVKFISGINFKSFSTSFKLYDSAGTYNARNISNKYVNHFNLLEVPLSLRFQLGSRRNLPLSLQTGITISQLISSNALQLNSSAGYYYKDNSLLNKTQIGFNTSFLLTLFPKQKNSILIGPYFYYDASKIAGKGLYNKKHFTFTGLHMQIIFGK
ncbi:MAG: outer membrane beta-barrel protein, partial [Ginsengibacter sp.]